MDKTSLYALAYSIQSWAVVSAIHRQFAVTLGLSVTALAAFCAGVFQ